MAENPTTTTTSINRIAMKILFFLGFPNPFPGAGWTRVAFFASFFKDRGHDVSVAGIFSPKSVKQAWFKYWRSIRIYNLCPTFWVESVPSLMFNVFSSLVFYPLITLLLRPKLVIISVPTGEPAVGAFFSSKLAGAKVVFDVRDEWEDYIISKASSHTYKVAYKLFKALMTRIYAKSNLIVAVTPNIVRSLLLRGVKDVKLLPNGADVSIFKPYGKASVREGLGLKKDDFILVYSGGLGGYYRLDIVVKAMVRLDSMIRGKIKLLIVGSEDVPQLVSLAEEVGLKDNIVYLGVKNDKKELAEILSSGDVGIVPYDDNPLWKNSVPAKFYEYCACGIPVIATAHNDSLIAEMIRTYQIGLVSPPLNEEKLTDAIYWLYKNKPFREAAGKRARQLIEEKFDRNRIAEEYLSIIKEVIA